MQSFIRELDGELINSSSIIMGGSSLNNSIMEINFNDSTEVTPIARRHPLSFVG